MPPPGIRAGSGSPEGGAGAGSDEENRGQEREGRGDRGGLRRPAARARLRRAGHFSLNGQREVTKRNPPRCRGRWTPVHRLRERATGFVDGPSMDQQRTRAHRGRAPVGWSSARSPRHRGPMGEAARSCAQKPKLARFRSALLRARCARFYRGPYEVAEERRRIRGKAKLFEYRDVRVVWRPESGEHRREPQRRERCGNRLGWPLFWLLFSGHAEKSDPLAQRVEALALQ